MVRYAMALSMSLCAWPATGATVYLCKAYSGGMFWSSENCGAQQAVIDRMVTVPDGLSWEQQVQLGEQARRQGAALAAAPAPAPEPPPPQPRSQAPRYDARAECRSLADRVNHLDSMARQPQSGRTQDWISEEKRRVRDRQARLRC